MTKDTPISILEAGLRAAKIGDRLPPALREPRIVPASLRASRRRSRVSNWCQTLALGGLSVIMLTVHVSVVTAQDGFPGVKKLMSDAEFNEAGLDKLSNDEIQALDQWLIRYTAGDAEVLQATNEEVREAQQDHEIQARIEGEFSGWSGETVFRLDNGQVWRQRLDGRYRYKGPANPEVLIDRNWLGFYRMTVVETGKSIGVTPLR